MNDIRQIVERSTLGVHLMFPTVIGERAKVQSRCPHTDKPVTLTVTQQGMLSLQPEDAVISLVPVAAEGGARSATSSSSPLDRQGRPGAKINRTRTL